MSGLIATIAAYLVGSIPWGYLAGRLVKGIDLRTVGSGGTGATNVLRSLGVSASAAVLALDFLKGLVPVMVARGVGLEDWWVAAVAVATVVGHCWSPFIGFKGGKGVATGAAAAIALFPATLLAVPVLAITVWRTRYVSLGSLLGAATAALLALASGLAGHLPWPFAVAILAISAIIFIRHRSNIERLISGSERRIGESLSV